MAKILGLDLGTTSIGWALVDNQTNEIIKTGVRIFPIGVQEDTFNKTHKEESKNAKRREKRLIRRQTKRFKLRRNRLRKILIEENIINEDFTIDKNSQPGYIYYLRDKALNEKLSLEELARVFFNINQKRGFLSNRKDKSKDKETGVVNGSIDKLTDEIKNSGCQTLGSYFWKLYQDANILNTHNELQQPTDRIRQRYTSRAQYEHEFNLIWNKQKAYHPQLTGSSENNTPDTLYFKIKTDCIFSQRPLKSQKHNLAKCRFEPKSKVCSLSHPYFQEFRTRSIINNIRFDANGYTNEELTNEAKQELYHLVKTEKTMEYSKLSKDFVFKVASKYYPNLDKGKFKINYQKVDETAKFKGNLTAHQLSKALGTELYEDMETEFFANDDINIQQNSRLYRLWNILLTAEENTWLYQYLTQKLGYNNEQAEKLLECSLEDGYSNISIKALRNILPYMREQGLNYSDACMHFGYNHTEDNTHHNTKETIPQLKNNELRNPIVQQALSEISKLVNKVIEVYQKPDEIHIEMAKEFRMPKDRRESLYKKNNDTQKRREEYKTFLRKLKFFNGKDIKDTDIKKFELYLELMFHVPDLESKLTKNSIDKKEFEKFCKKINTKDTTKYELWKEAERVCPYTNKPMSLSQVFSDNPDFEVEHILPYSRTLDNSFANKTLSCKIFNAQKGNKTPFEHFNSISKEAWKAFKERIKDYPEGKKRRLLTEKLSSSFNPSSLTDTAYIGTEIRKRLEYVCPKIIQSNGAITSMLRKSWGLNTILNKEGKDVKDRGDHRHHAIDAIVTAFTTHKLIHNISNNAEFRDKSDYPFINQELTRPFLGFRDAVEQSVDTILISYKGGKRLITKRKNTKVELTEKIKTNGNKTFVKKIKKVNTYSIAARGELHEETLYGKIKHPVSNTPSYVIRKPLSDKAIADDNFLKKIIDKSVRNKIKEAQIRSGFEIKEGTVHFTTKRGYPYTIKKVRIEYGGEAFEPLYQEPARNGFVEKTPYIRPGNNYYMAIYQEPLSLRREFKVFTFFEAVQNAKQGNPVIPPHYKKLPLFMKLQQKDCFVMYNNSPDEIDWFDKEKISKNLYILVTYAGDTGRLYFAYHLLSKSNVMKDPAPLKIWPLYKDFKGIKVKIDVLGNIEGYYDKEDFIPLTKRQTLA